MRVMRKGGDSFGAKMAQCKKCGGRANLVQIDDTNDPDCDWELSCGCGLEPHYDLSRNQSDPYFIQHVARKSWSTPKRMATLIDLRQKLGWPSK